MPNPDVNLFPSQTLFPGDGTIPVPVDGGTGVLLNGMYLAGVDGFGCEWRTFAPISGWDGSPASSQQPTQKTRAPGAWPGPRELTQKPISITGIVRAPTEALVSDGLDRLNAAAALDACTLTIAKGNSVRSAIVYRQGEVSLTEVTATLYQWSVDLVALDPRRFATAVIGSSGLPFVSGGLTIPYTIPYLIDSVVDTGTVSLDNQGNTDGPCVVRFDGPLTGPQVTHVQSGLTLAFSSSLVLGVDEFLLIDADPSALTALANGQSPRNGLITSRGWPGFQPGVNDYVFGAVAGSGLMTITGTPSWL